MSNKITVANFGILDGDMDTFLPGCFKNVPGIVKVFSNFDYSRLIGRATVIEENNELKIETEFVSDKYSGMYPAIGFEVIKYSVRENGEREIQEAKLWQVSFCNQPNADLTIKPIS